MKDDKFILMGLNDDKAGYVAEVLKNKTCKKILDFLAEIREASEKDISDGLKMPINTIEYNLKKLIKSGLVVRTKNFFWSVKGKKIPMYKLARKHIIISPGKKPSLSALKSVLPVIFALAALAIFITLMGVIPKHDSETQNLGELKQFSTEAELKQFLEDNTDSGGFFGDAIEALAGGFARTVGTTADSSKSLNAPMAAEESVEADSGAGGGDFSTTNVQVEGVDEADIVKTDGKYIYAVTSGTVKIVEAYPAENMKILSELNLSGVRDIYINEDKLIVFTYGYSHYPYSVGVKAAVAVVDIAEDSKSVSVPRPNFNNVVQIYDIEDKENPELEEEIAMEGSYTNSRMIGDYVYVVSTKYVNTRNPEPPVFARNGQEQKIALEDIYYWDYPDSSYIFTSISAINVDDGEFNNKVFLTGASQNIYISKDNIYLTYSRRFDYKEYASSFSKQVALPVLSLEYDEKIEDIMDSEKSDYLKLNEMKEVIEDYSDSFEGDEKTDFAKELAGKLDGFESYMQKKMEKTVIHKINVDKEEIEYMGVGEAPGYVLNQFSMDEYQGYFRIATTTGNFWQSSSMNNLYILDEDLEIVGMVEDLAKGEKIYSARFMGDRAYMVTFKNVDPLFVIDTSNPEKPEVLGYLKITGYSGYLHPYDENHLIGIGKEAVAADENVRSNFAWYQGVKVSLFDVTDVENPREVAKIEIGDRGTSSEALYNHKAVLFDKEKGILVIPIDLHEIDESRYGDYKEMSPSAYGEKVWSGAYVLNINKEEISVRGKITHDEEIEAEYGPASEESIGAIRKDRYKNAWVKIADNVWVSDAKGYQNTRWIDKNIDEFPGGIKYRPYNYDYKNRIQRSLYIGDVLYTISQAKIKANDLITIYEIDSVKISESLDYPVWY